jgi:hypothetical protein
MQAHAHPLSLPVAATHFGFGALLDTPPITYRATLLEPASLLYYTYWRFFGRIYLTSAAYIRTAVCIVAYRIPKAARILVSGAAVLHNVLPLHLFGRLFGHVPSSVG